MLSPARRLFRALAIAALLLALAAAVSLWAGEVRISLAELRGDPAVRALFFRLRLPRVVMAALVGASLASVGTVLQALFRNPLAEPFTLGVSGGGAVGASVAIALGWGTRVSGVPLVFVAAFLGALSSVALVYRMARSGATVLPGALLLAGIVLNLIAGAGVIIMQYLVDPGRALQILRWTIGTVDTIGFGLIWRMLVFLVPCWFALLCYSRDLHLIAVDDETAPSLGVNVRRCERAIYAISSVIVGVTVATGGAIGFVGLIVPHAVRLVFGEDVRIVLPCSFLAGAAFLMLADTVARTALGGGELPVGAVTALLGGPAFLWLLRRHQRYSSM